MVKTKKVVFAIGVNPSANPIFVIHFLADDKAPGDSKKNGVPQKRKGSSPSGTRNRTCRRTRESQRNWRLPIMDSKQPDNASQALAEEPVQILRAFDNGTILLVEEFPRIKVSLPGISFLIMKTNKGYLFRGMNGNTVGAGYWGLTGENIYEKTGHRGAYIFPDGSGGCMNGLSGALAVCRIG